MIFENVIKGPAKSAFESVTQFNNLKDNEIKQSNIIISLAATVTFKKYNSNLHIS